METNTVTMSMRQEIAYVILMTVMLTSVAVALVSIPPQAPTDETAFIAPHDHFDVNRTIEMGTTVNMEINLLEPPPKGAEFPVFSIMDSSNYFLKMNGSHAYTYIMIVRTENLTRLVWQAPAHGEYYFILENPGSFNVTARLVVSWELPLPLVIPIALSISCLIIASFSIAHDEMLRRYVPQIIELRGDLNMVPDLVISPPQSLHYVIIKGPAGRRCAICNTQVAAGEPVLSCPRCGSSLHREHFLAWVRAKGYCPVCKKRIDEKDLKT